MSDRTVRIIGVVFLVVLCVVWFFAAAIVGAGS